MDQTTNFVLPHWIYWGWLAIMPFIFMWLSKGARINELGPENNEYSTNKLTRWLDWSSNASGLFVSLWTVNAVCVYFFEVVSRYIFDAPTIWAHQSSYLLFGMQYLLAGGLALLHGDHVRVDVVYIKMSRIGQVATDIFSSIFFFIFAIALAGTCWRFFFDSLDMAEVTEETWQIQIYPVKGMMVLGAILLALAGLSKLIKDIQLFRKISRGAA